MNRTKALTLEEASKRELLSLDLVAQRFARLRKIVPEAFGGGGSDEVDWDLFQKLMESPPKDKGEEENEDSIYHPFGLVWKGMDEAMKEAGKQITKCLRPQQNKSLSWDQTQNVFIEGENLEVLKLLGKAYGGKVKAIYIDPPYNTGNDFVYSDRFAQKQKEYWRESGQTDESGKAYTTNKESDGRLHSNWLSMICPRLMLARELLRDDGVIFVSINDNEVHHLRMLLDKVFGDKNFMSTVSWVATKSVTNTALISQSHQYQIIYAKNKSYFKENRKKFRIPETGEGFKNLDNDPRGPWKADPFQVEGERPDQQYKIINPVTKQEFYPNDGCSWKNDSKKFKVLLEEERIVFGIGGEAGPSRKRFLSEALKRGRVSKTLWDDVGTTSNGTSELKKLFGKSVFNNPKPTSLIKKCIQLGTCDTQDAIVLDFFAGSCTTAHAVMQLNAEDGGQRRFVMVQIPEATPVGSGGRKAGYETIADIGRERIRRAAKKIKQNFSKKDIIKKNRVIDLGFRSFKLDSSNFKIWEDTIEKIPDLQNNIKDHIDKRKEKRTNEDLIYEVLLKHGSKLTDLIRQETIGGHKCHFVGEDKNLMFCLENKVKESLLDALENMNVPPHHIFLFDYALEDNASLRVNFYYSMKDKARGKKEIKVTTL